MQSHGRPYIVEFRRGGATCRGDAARRPYDSASEPSEPARVPPGNRVVVRQIFEPNIYLYDSYPGGVGLSEPLFRLSDSLLEKTHKLISECPCPNGCPSCVGPAGEIGERGKEVALEILRRMIAGTAS